ncbi:nuclear transport factor 2 family protein [Niveispirillum fermenti]|uniref:nuclear transport factor 2 family protein n=1 Tax=Niveispirillum fermenti TaxID=1233113 RepID=UPI003A898C26
MKLLARRGLAPIALATAALLLPLAPSARVQAAEGNIPAQRTALKVVEDAFAWFNDVGARRTALTREGVATHFHPQASIRIDNEMKGIGAEGMYLRFAEMLEKLDYWEATQPFTIALTDGDHAAGQYQYRYRDKQGGTGVIDLISIWTVRDGKVLDTVEQAKYSGADLSLATHGKDGGTAKP